MNQKFVLMLAPSICIKWIQERIKEVANCIDINSRIINIDFSRIFDQKKCFGKLRK